MKKTITFLALASFIATSSTFAHNHEQAPTGAPGMPPQGQQGERVQQIREIRQEIRGDIREGAQGVRNEFQELRKDAVSEFKEDMKERRAWNTANASGTASDTVPTPWKDFREDMKDSRNELKENIRNTREEIKDEFRNMRSSLPPRVIPLTDAQTAVISAKLGISADALKAQLASGTRLKDIVKDKIDPTEMKQILPPKVATLTRAKIEQGIFDNFRSRIFGQRQEVVEQVQNEFGEIQEITKSVPPQGFFRRLFNW